MARKFWNFSQWLSLGVSSARKDSAPFKLVALSGLYRLRVKLKHLGSKSSIPGSKCPMIPHRPGHDWGQWLPLTSYHGYSSIPRVFSLCYPYLTQYPSLCDHFTSILQLMQRQFSRQYFLNQYQEEKRGK